MLSKACNASFQTVEAVYSCFDSLTFSKEELLFNTRTVSFKDPVFTNISTAWTTTIQVPVFGRCQTARTFGKMDEASGIKLDLNSSMDYKIFLHDPDFFILPINPSSTPVLGIPLELTGSNMSSSYSVMQYILAEENILLDRDNYPCTDYRKSGSSFTQCVMDHISKSTGCRVNDFHIPFR